jgi:hypothetical protein
MRVSEIDGNFNKKIILIAKPVLDIQMDIVCLKGRFNMLVCS